MGFSGGGLGSKAIKTFDLLDQIVTILGSTKLAFYPYLTAIGTDVHPYGSGNDALVGTAQAAVEAGYDPIPLNGIHALYNDESASRYIDLGDDADYSHEADTAFSIGAWVYMTEALGSARTIISCFGSTSAQEEYDLRLDTSGFPVLELHDASASATEVATSDDAVTPFIWQHVVATYNGVAGGSANAGIALYINGAAVSAITLSDSGAYVAMEDAGSNTAIGARDTDGTAAQEFEGYMALPFIAGTELTAANVSALYGLSRLLVGV